MKRGIKISLLVALVCILTLSVIVCAKPAPTTPAPTTTAPTTPSPTTPAPTTPKPTTPAPTTAAPTPTAPAQMYKWNFQTVSPGEIEVNAWKNWAQRIKTASAGQMDITVLPAGAITSPTEAWNAVPKGVLEIARTSFGYVTGKLPEAALFHEVPGAIQTVDDYLSLYRDYGWLQKARDTFGELGVFLIAPNPGGGKPFWSVKPITTVKDVKGLKIRTFALISDLFKYMGSSTSMIPHEESYMALSLGTVEAYSSSIGTVYIDLKHYEIAPYIMLPSLSATGSTGIIANPDLWNGLPDNLKQIIQDATDYMMWENWANGDCSVDWFAAMKFISQIREKGYKIEFVTMSPELQAYIAEAGVAILDNIAKKNARAADLVKDMKSVMKIKGYID